MPKKVELQFDLEVKLITYLWEPINEKPKAAVIIAHGMAEHILRYEDLANFLTSKGFLVIGYDHYGHGESAISIDKIGVIEKYDFVDALIKGLKLVYDEMKEKYNLPFYLFAHSMGSIMAQRYLQLHPTDFDKVILSGVTANSLKVRLGKYLAYLIMKFKGPISYTKLVYKMSIQPFSKPFKNEHPHYGFISSKMDEVVKYDNNKYCGAIFPTNYYYSLTKTIIEANKKRNLKKLNPKLNIFIIGGENDPVANYGKFAFKINNLYQQNQILSNFKIYPEARHECHNEKDNIKSIVYQDIYEFYRS